MRLENGLSDDNWQAQCETGTSLGLDERKVEVC